MRVNAVCLSCSFLLLYCSSMVTCSLLSCSRTPTPAGPIHPPMHLSFALPFARSAPFPTTRPSKAVPLSNSPLPPPSAPHPSPLPLTLPPLPPLTTALARSSLVLSMPFMIRSMICSTQAFSQPAGMRGKRGMNRKRMHVYV